MNRRRKIKICEKVMTITYLVIAILAGYQFACGMLAINKWRESKCIGNTDVCEKMHLIRYGSKKEIPNKSFDLNSQRSGIK